MKHALITGIFGQDGSYLAKHLLELGYKVYGLRHRQSATEHHPNHKFLNITGEIDFLDGDITDAFSLFRAIEKLPLDEVYNLAAQSYVGASWSQPIAAGQVTALGAHNVYEAVRNINPNIRVYQASSSEMFGKVRETPQTENTPFYPRSPYGVAKQYAHSMAVNYRESFGMFIACGILFNHESPLRGEQFVTRKITKAVANILHYKQDSLFLGNVFAKRDWGHAKDYVKAMHLMLQVNQPDDFVIATGKTRSVMDFYEESFRYVGLISDHYVYSDPALHRPSEVDILLGDATKAKEILGWVPETSFEDLVHEMVDHDLKGIKQ